MSVGEHLEYEPHATAIAHADRNRADDVVKRAAEVKLEGFGLDARPLMVLNGSEVTKAARSSSRRWCAARSRPKSARAYPSRLSMRVFTIRLD